MSEFLLELLIEEIPARMQVRAAESLHSSMSKFLAEQGLPPGTINVYGTPRRLTVVASKLPGERPAKSEEKKGPRVGSPDQAIQGFLKSSGLARIEDAEIRKTDKGDFYFAMLKQPAVPTIDVLPVVVSKTVDELAGTWAKSMVWNDGQKSWVRPLRGLVAILDGKTIPIQLDFGGTVQIVSGNQTSGHRFMGARQPIAVTSFSEYQTKLRAANVIIDRDERKKMIMADIEKKSAAIGLKPRNDDGLLDEVAGLVEWPVVLIGNIDPEFMVVPDRVLITSMRQHQKYFALLNPDGSLANKFAVVANIESKDGGKTIIAGNERVLRARLHDAKFFFEQDRKIKLEQRLPKLKDIVFHAKLGTIGQKVERLAAMCKTIAPKFGADPVLALDAATLCKADLVTGMVGEFPELQGYMGGQYAKLEGESEAVAAAIADHYKPLGPNDDVPTAPLSAALALADKIDTLVGFFTAGEKPTGSKDPFALRRAALGVIRLVLENRAHLSLNPLIDLNYGQYAEHLEQLPFSSEQIKHELMEFFHDRLKVYLKDKNIRHDIIAAVLSASGDSSDLLRISQRAEALGQFLGGEMGAALLAAYRRAANIVKAEVGKDKQDYSGAVDSRLLQQEAEIQIFGVLQKSSPAIKTAIEQSKYADAMQLLAALREPLDAFFTAVKVNADDPQLRDNRLRLLNQIRSTMDSIADFSKIEA